MDAPLPADRALLDAFRRGDRAALTRVYRAYSPRVLAYLSRGFRVRSDGGTGGARVGPLDLDAAHQETFVRAFSERVRQAYDGLRPFEGFLLAIARSAAVDTLRAAGKLSRSSVSLEDAPELQSLAAEHASPEDSALEGEMRALVAGFLSRLSAQERRFADLRFVERLSQEQAGAALGLSRQEARTREVRLKRALAEFLAAEGWMDAGSRSSGPGPGSGRAVAALLLLALLQGVV
ncbi:MAG TPA: sigma-70 family RNA polymerase sigma factor [Anaeromyxobacter sp.]|nr:sigma-70 family RNA polymerase sigma factor [Anaeromyxobacter sp.]